MRLVLVLLLGGCGGMTATGDGGASPDLAGADLAGADLAGADLAGGAGDLAMGGDAAGPCTPSCAGKACGDDGCGGNCGGCPQNQLCGANGACGAAGPDPIDVDVGATGGAIHPEIYGVAFAAKSTLEKLHLGLNRWGGNGSTRYNFQLDVHNTASDYFFENIADTGEGTFGQNGYVSSSDVLVRDTLAAGAAALVTIPTIGWTPKDRVAPHPFTCGFPVSKYGPQMSVDPYDTNCGNGVAPGGKLIIANVPSDTSVAAPPAFETMWLQHLLAKFGAAGAGGVRFYALDNEMNLWSSTHRDVHPKPVSYDEVWSATSSYAPVIRAADPSATILGYGTWGVLDLFESNLDTTNMNSADQMAHGGAPLAKWYLAQLAAYEKQNGKRLVDCLDLHLYPQGGDPLQNTRSLWDPTYRDPSWIDQFLGEPVRLFPRVAEWIAAAYPGTGVCVSEYNWMLGMESDPTSALAEADVLGIFGRHGVRLAAFWTTPVDGNGNLQPVAQAFRLYRDYDGAGAQFAPIAVAASNTVAGVSVFASTDAGASKVTIVVINKNQLPVATTIGLLRFAPAATAKAYQYVAQANAKVAPIADVAVAGGKLAVTLPARSMTLYAIPKQ